LLAHRLGLEQGWIPENPRTIVGVCTSLISENGFTVNMTENPAPTLSAWMTGGAGAGTMLDEAMVTSFSAWPPTALQGTTTEFLPTYTPTGDAITMPTPTVTSYPSGYSSSANVGDGWFNPSDTAGQMTPVAGCTYPDAWSGAGAAGQFSSSLLLDADS
jgi:glucan 1,3-beta-glucosidase